MNIHNKNTIIKYAKKHARAKKALDMWYHDVSSKWWKKPNDVKKDFRTADILPNNRVVFNIKGNSYRLIAEINYKRGWLFIKFIGTHAEYENVDTETIHLSK